MSVRAKMFCNSKTEGLEGEFTVQLFTVTDGSDENEQYFKYTPGGQCTLAILNKSAADQFEQGKEYYVTFEEAGV
jgi:hypothetical protein